MSASGKSYISYEGLRQQRLLLAGLVLGLVAVVIGILLEVYYRGARATQISLAVQRLAEPLNPVLNTEVLSQLDSYEQMSLEQIKGMFALTPPSQAILSQLEAQESASGSAQTDVVQQTVEENTLTEEEILSDEELNSLLEESEATPEAQPQQ